ncbi:uncharacterized protein LOC124940088 [Impatiens glandulifera]|uniref:uncharacterized protein LOC124940088 n=1 Tax=Impatiens glandulifera TaxID=253017 RepID=UPI001FB173FC|nr:uncharacterized protein LOC124940088 [Impatiens glandulifera]
MGLINSGAGTSRTQKFYLLCNYALIGASSSCIFLTLSLRLIPSPIGFLLIFLHVLTIAGAVSGCAAASGSGRRWYGAQMVATVVTAIFQGSVAVLSFTVTDEFLGRLNSYVREEEGKMILKLGGGLCFGIFCLEWIVLTLAFFLSYRSFVEGGNGNNMNGSAKTAPIKDDELTNWPWPFQV